ncbi:hypothetical protein ACO0OE_000645 [Hanseniaspora uvarum]
MSLVNDQANNIEMLQTQLTFPNVVNFLLNSLSPDQNVRIPSEQSISAFLESSLYPEFYYILSSIICDESINIPEVRVLASIVLKNNLISLKNNVNMNKKYQSKWFQINEDVRNKIKENSLKALSSQVNKVANSASQVIAALAYHELGNNSWNLLPLLVSNTSPENNANLSLKRSSLLSIGYICEQGITSNDTKLITNLRMNSDAILTGLVQGCQTSSNDASTDTSIKLTAINSLIDALDFIDENMNRDQERNYLMQVVCELTQSSSVDLKIAAFGCLCKIFSHYYFYMKTYMEQAIYLLTINILKDINEDPRVKSLVIELWSTICEEEIDLQVSIEQYDSVELAIADDPKLVNYNFSLTAITDLIPLILDLLIKDKSLQDADIEDIDNNEWDVSMSAGACLQLFAKNCGNYIMFKVLTWIQEHLAVDDWRYRDAAIMAFGCVLDGPDANELTEVVKQALQSILMLMEDQSIQVKETVSWCIGRIIEFAMDAITSNDLPNIIQALLLGFKDHAKIVTNCCWSLMNLIERVELEENYEFKKILSVNYPVIVEHLMAIVNDDSNDNEYSCRSSAFSALNTVVENIPEYNKDTSLAIFNMTLNKLLTLISMDLSNVTSHQRMIANEYMSGVLSLLSCCIRNLPKSQVKVMMPSIQQHLMNLLSQATVALEQGEDSYIEEDVFYCMSAVMNCMSEDFLPYLDTLAPILAATLKRPDTQACKASVGLIGDICLELGSSANAFSASMIPLIGAVIQAENATNETILQVISTLGEIATAFGEGFYPYVSDIVGLCNSKFVESLREKNEQEELGTNNYDSFKYYLNINAAILDCYAGIISGFIDAPMLIGDFIESIFELIQNIYIERVYYKEDKEYVLRTALGMIGDIGMMYPSGVFKSLFASPWVSQFIQYIQHNASTCSESTITSTKWALGQQQKQLSL